MRAGSADKGVNGSDDLDDIEGVVGTVFNDVVIGSAGINTLLGNNGNDRLIGLAGEDLIDGGIGNDVLFGNSGNDILQGGAGKDRLIGGFGADSMAGGAGNDTYFVDSSEDTITEDAEAGIDTVIIAPGTTVGAFANVEVFILDFGPGQNGVLNGNVDGQTFIGGSGNDVLNGNAGDDTLIGSGGDDFLNGGADNDLLKGNAGADLLQGGDGNDIIIGGAGNDAIGVDEGDGEGAAGGNAIFEAVQVGPGGVPAAVESGLRGGDGIDRINGQAGDDIIEGGAGADRIIGGSGNDQLVGGLVDQGGDGAADRFAFSSGSGLDIIFDFENGIDKIDFRGLNLETGLFPTFEAIEGAISESEGNAVISLGSSNVITLIGVAAANLDASDFILADLA